MSKLFKSLTARCLGGSCGLAAAGLILGATPPLDKGVYPGITKPSEQRDVTFNGPGVVAEEFAKEGDTVKEGQLLAAQDAAVEQAHAKAVAIEADSTLQVEAAKADHDAKQVELKRTEQMHKDRVVGDSELEKAQVDETIAAIRIKLAAQEQLKARGEVLEEEARIKLKHLSSPVDGIVLKINTHVGEAVSSDVTKPVMTIVKNDPLYVEVDMPTGVVKNLRKDQALQVRYPDEDKWLAGQVIFIAPQADARSGTQHVKLQMPNPTGRYSGIAVQVKGPENVAEIRPGDR